MHELNRKGDYDSPSAQAARKQRNWGRATIYLGLALVISVASVVPFLDGNSLHSLWSPFGVALVMISMGLLIVFLYSAATTLNMRMYSQNLRKIDKNIARGRREKFKR